MPPPSLARDFFERIIDPDPVAFLRGLINSSPPTVETDWLDFKTEHHDPKQREKDIHFEWSRSLGGFANNQGGVLVWGVDARKTKVGGVEIDFACGEKPMTDPLALRSRLVELQRGATDPPMANVDVRAYELADDPGKGFVVCYIPEGPFKPYRSEQADRQWYIRAGDNFAVMSPAVLRAMFYPRTKAVFRLDADLSWVFPDEGQVYQRHEIEMALSVGLTNEGTATAKDVLFMVMAPNITQEEFASMQMGAGWQREAGYFRRLQPVHPRTPMSEVFSWRWMVPGATSFAQRGNTVVPYSRITEFVFVVYAENQEPQYFEAKFDVDELRVRRQVSIELSPRDSF